MLKSMLLFVLSTWFLNGIVFSQDMTPDEAATYNKFLEDQNRLWTDLFKNYNPTISAIYTLHTSKFVDQNRTAHPPITELNLTLGMLKLVDVVEVEEKVTFLFDYIAEYKDSRLKWDPLEYGGIDHIYVPQKAVWLPEITIADAHEIKFFESDDAPRTAWINYNGTTGFYTSTVASVICQMDVFKFPLDHHECGVSILFHTYFADEYEIKSLMGDIGKPLALLGNGEWKVTYVGVDEEPHKTGDVQRFIARIERNPGFYVALVMIPAFFINFLSIIALFINIEDITVGLTNIMAMTFILVILAADLPKTARIPLLAIYVIVGLVIVMTSIAVVLVLPFIRKYQKKNKNNEMGEELIKTRLGRFYNWLKLEYVLMMIFQMANFINFIILFM
uniref:Neur_chan_LBD domain-containing protein n=1 Tax=Caenorhabditis tropicalis TaxID=1561998 RepID=A0A1I7TXM2_9PELO